MQFFLDTEWADTLGAELISLALVSASGAHRFYAEIDPLPEVSTDFVRAAVYPLLDRGDYAMPEVEFTRALRRFLVQFSEVSVIYDYSVDGALFQYALDGFESQADIGATPAALEMLKVGPEVRVGIERFFMEHPELAKRRHHAAVDAEALRYACMRLWPSE